MEYIIDTHTMIWFYENTLSAKLYDILENPENDIFISNISLWEIAIKLGIKKLKMGCSLKELYGYIEDSGFEIINFSKDDILNYQKLPFHHRDPFDGMIISQTMTRDIPIISFNKAFDNYNIIRIY